MRHVFILTIDISVMLTSQNIVF